MSTRTLVSTMSILPFFFVTLIAFPAMAKPTSDAAAWRDHALQLPPWSVVRKMQAEKRHLQSLLPYHPVVRFRGLGGPGDSWPENAADLGALVASFNQMSNGGPSHLEVPTTHEVGELPPVLEGDSRIHAEGLNAGDLLTLLESMVGIHDEGTARVIKSVRFGTNDGR